MVQFISRGKIQSSGFSLRFSALRFCNIYSHLSSICRESPWPKNTSGTAALAWSINVLGTLLLRVPPLNHCQPAAPAFRCICKLHRPRSLTSSSQSAKLHGVWSYAGAIPHSLAWLTAVCDHIPRDAFSVLPGGSGRPAEEFETMTQARPPLSSYCLFLTVT